VVSFALMFKILSGDNFLSFNQDFSLTNLVQLFYHY